MASIKLPEVDRLNSMSKSEFFEIVNLLFETAPPLADAIWLERPFHTYEAIVKCAEQLYSAKAFSSSQLVEIINAHPRIGAPKVQLSIASQQEQGHSSTANDDQVMARLKDLNDQYERKFGFKFVVFVNGRSRADIIPVLEQRMQNSPEAELATGIQAMFDIARDRIK
eukprot:Partr_v1_DN23624_c1_g1_i2_m19097 putative Conserved hypothetical protein